MSEPRKKYDSTVARIAGNLLSGCAPMWVTSQEYARNEAAKTAVLMARAIIRATEESEPPPEEQP